ncbi:hypothetical protein BDP27DRAFT_1449288 [Rhodocollybia butyracea]|uniref:Uncharacterized protein n=1 Tax=Rhodocollybia butyracea TaxID=206335 RepID=A0A9P5PPE2_9AGAR|nr:hypothetical protein BDP27DRAFT_1449288 [Rhodocollybia butyracea]
MGWPRSSNISKLVIVPALLVAPGLCGPISSSNTTSLGDNTSNGTVNPDLVCVPASIFTVLAFISANYITHAITTQAIPGERTWHTVIALATALMLPGAGAARGLNNIVRGGLMWRMDNDLNKAAAAGALCMIIRSRDWKPPTQSQYSTEEHEDPNRNLKWAIEPFNTCQSFLKWKFIDEVHPYAKFESIRMIHGTRSDLPKGYSYVLVPPMTRFRNSVAPNSSSSSKPKTTIACSRNVAKAVIGLVQVVYAIYTMYKAQGSQIQRFGYAAFSLTAAPYAVMSFINFLGSILTPVYPCMYLVRNEVMNEVETCYGGLFDGTVGEVQHLDEGRAVESLYPEEEASSDGRGEEDDEGEVMEERSPSTGPKSFQRQMTPLIRPIDQPRPEIRIPACAPLDLEYPIDIQSGLPDISINIFVTVVVTIVGPVLINFGISHFEEGNSTPTQRAVFIIWLFSAATQGAVSGCGGVAAFSRQIQAIGDDSERIFKLGLPGVSFIALHLAAFCKRIQERMHIVGPLLGVVALVIAPLLWSIPAFWGFVIVGQMIISYGDCALV